MTKEQALKLKHGDKVLYKVGNESFNCLVVEENKSNPWATWRYNVNAKEPIEPKDEFGYLSIQGDNNFFAWLSNVYLNVV